METHPQPNMEKKGGIPARFVAVLIDGILIAIVAGIFGAIAAAAAPRLVGPLAQLGGLLGLVYYIYMEGSYGYTLGKKVMGLVVVKEDGGDCDMTASVIRNVLRIIDGIALYLVGVVVILLTDRDQRIGDLAGSTVVVKTA